MATYPLVVYPERSRRAPNLFALASPATKKDFRSNLTKWFIDSNKKNKKDEISRVALRRVETSPILFKLIILLIFGEFYVFANLKNIFNNLKKIFADFALSFSNKNKS